MSRPKKCRKVCRLPENTCFMPIVENNNAEAIVLNVDEYETLRLIDKEGFSQEQCGEYMHVARTTVQQIYTNARKKVAEALVEGCALKIGGGDYSLCEGKESYCDCGGCKRHARNNIKEDKGENIMRIAIPLDENKVDVCPVLARTPFFLFVENGTSTVVENPASSAQGGAGLQVAQFIIDNNINVLITPRCGQNAGDVFNEADIKIYKSLPKSAMDNVTSYVSGELDELTHFHGGFHGIQ